jgi:site-specific recombinase XerD
MATAASHLQVVADNDRFLPEFNAFVRALKARNKNQTGHTERIYRHGVFGFRDWLIEHGQAPDPLMVTRDDVRAYLADLFSEGKAPATVKAAFTGIAAFFNYLEDEGMLERSPTRRMHAPSVPETPTRVLDADELGRLLKAVQGTGFEDRRDLAMFRLFIDTGLRRNEMASLMLEDLDLEGGLVRVTIKGGDTKLAPYGAKTARDLDRYLRLRARHRQAVSVVDRDGESVHPLWLSAYGGLSSDGVYNVVKRRAVQAGLDPKDVHPHTFRHSFAHALKAAGASDEDIQSLGRWHDSRMVKRYGAAMREQRAWATLRRLSPGDRI